MIIIDEDTRQKIKTLDKILGTYSLEELQDLTNGDVVASKLKGVPLQMETLTALLNNAEANQMWITQLQSDVRGLQNDLSALLKILNQTVYNYNADFQNLKQKHNVY